jgi:modulator of FtsH protease
MYAQPQAQRLTAAEAFARGIPAELTVFVRKTYGLLAFSLALCAAACWLAMSILPVHVVGRQVSLGFPRWILWALWGGTLVFSIVGNMARSGSRQGDVSATGLVGLFGMVLCAGAMLSPTIGIYVGLGMANVVLAAAVTTAVVFTGLTGFVLVTGKNFSFMGGFLFAAGLAFFVAWMIGAFLIRSAGFQWWMSAAGALLFSAFILFDTSRVVREYGQGNLVVPAVIALFLDIFNLFVMLLYLFGGRRRD